MRYTAHSSIPLAEYTMQTLHLLRGFAVHALQSPHNPQKARRWYGLDVLWKLTQQAASADLRTMATNMLGDLLCWPQCFAQRPAYLENCVGQLRLGEHVPQALRLCQRICSSFPLKPRKKSESLQSVLEWLDQQHDLLGVFFSDFARYHELATQHFAELMAAAVAADAGPAASAGASTALSTAKPSAVGGVVMGGAAAAASALSAAKSDHMSEVSERLAFLEFCTVQAPLSLSQQQVDVLWDCCVEHASSPVEADHFFGWLENCRIKSPALDLETTRHLFDRASALPLEDLSMTGFTCVEFLFKWVNWKENRFAQHDGAFSVLDLPLYGASTLWQVALRAKNEHVGKRIVHLLTQLHHSLVPELGAAQKQQRRSFVGTCMRSLASAADQLRAQQTQSQQQGSGGSSGSSGSDGDIVLADAPPADDGYGGGSPALRIERCLTLLRNFVEEVEAKLPEDDSSRRARRHGTAVRGTPMRILVTVVGGSNAPRFGETDSNQQVSSLRAACGGAGSGAEQWQPEAPRCCG